VVFTIKGTSSRTNTPGICSRTDKASICTIRAICSRPNAQGRHLYNEGDREHGFDRDRQGGPRNLDRRGVVSGNFFEHGRHFRFRRFFNGEWVFLNAWGDCTAYAWVNVAPGAWAWAPVNVCIG